MSTYQHWKDVSPTRLLPQNPIVRIRRESGGPTKFEIKESGFGIRVVNDPRGAWRFRWNEDEERFPGEMSLPLGPHQMHLVPFDRGSVELVAPDSSVDFLHKIDLEILKTPSAGWVRTDVPRATEVGRAVLSQSSSAGELAQTSEQVICTRAALERVTGYRDWELDELDGMQANQESLRYWSGPDLYFTGVIRCERNGVDAVDDVRLDLRANPEFPSVEPTFDTIAKNFSTKAAGDTRTTINLDRGWVESAAAQTHTEFASTGRAIVPLCDWQLVARILSADPVQLHWAVGIVSK